MKTLAIVGAGPGLGLSIAKFFGRNGFRVALIARNKAKLGALGIEAAGFPADLMDRPSLVDAFAQIKERYGAIDVLEYSPALHTPTPGLTIAGALSVAVENLQPQIDLYLHGAITVVHQVLPAMLALFCGTLNIRAKAQFGDCTRGPGYVCTLRTESCRFWREGFRQVKGSEPRAFAVYSPQARPEGPLSVGRTSRMQPSGCSARDKLRGFSPRSN
jgi:NAD(P)-dependent dehydrogenase (short-subunit alcohol dehydrogenase family)